MSLHGFFGVSLDTTAVRPWSFIKKWISRSLDKIIGEIKYWARRMSKVLFYLKLYLIRFFQNFDSCFYRRITSIF
jgi:hypothetical protein